MVKPYIGDLDDPNLEEHNKDNLYMLTGYRICFNTYRDCFNSLFMIHNETMNVWSHLIGAILFSGMVVYIITFLSPTSLHNSDSLVQRWSQDFDVGRFDNLMCDRESDFPDPNQCPYKTKELLDDLLETEKLLDWHKSKEAQQRPHMGHTNLNYHSIAYEKIDHYMRNIIEVLSNSP